MKKILTFAPAEIGDTIMSTPLYLSLKKTYPDSRITLISESIPHPVLEGINVFDEIIPYVESMDLESLRKSNDLIVLPVFAGGAKVERHFRPFADFSFDKLKKQIKSDWFSDNDRHLLFSKHQVEFNEDLAKLMGFKDSLPSVYCHEKPPSLYKSYKGFIGIYINTPINEFQGMPNRSWPMESWEKLILELKGEPLILLGGPSDLVNLSELSKRTNSPYFITPTLGDFTAMCRNLKMIVGCEGGSMHAAATTGTPVVALFAKASPVLLHPWITDKGKCIAVLSPNACSPCDRSYNLRLTNAGWKPMNCMRNLTVPMVRSAMKDILELRSGTVLIKKGNIYYTKEKFLKNLKRKTTWLWSYHVSKFLLHFKFVWEKMKFAVVNRADIQKICDIASRKSIWKSNA